MQTTRALKLAVLMALVTLAAALPARAASPFCGSFGGKFDGSLVVADSTYMNMAKADVDGEPAAACDSVVDQGNVRATWVMIASEDTSPPGWAQVGFYRAPGNGFTYFTQWVKVSGVTTLHSDWFGSPSSPSVHTFRVERTNSASCNNPAGHCLVLKVDGSASGGEPYTSFDPHAVWAGSNALFFGETLYPGSDMSGESGDKTRFRNILEQDGPNTGSYSWAGANGGDCSYYKWGNPNSSNVYTQFNIWTDPLSHGNNCS